MIRCFSRYTDRRFDQINTQVSHYKVVYDKVSRLEYRIYLFDQSDTKGSFIGERPTNYIGVQTKEFDQINTEKV